MSIELDTGKTRGIVKKKDFLTQMFSLSAAILISGCASSFERAKLNSIHLIDQSDMVQMITEKKRLKQWDRRNFEASQPYKKIMRTFDRDDQNRQRGVINSYYPSGQLMQRLEISDGRANGEYQEWFENGQRRLQAFVLGGTPDLTPQAQSDWLFEGKCIAWDDKGNKAAFIEYRGGLREGLEQHFWQNGSLRKILPYSAGLLNGEEKQFDENGQLRVLINYKDGQRQGQAMGYWPSSMRSWFEKRDGNRLVYANYWDAKGRLLASIEAGEGWRIEFEKERVAEKQGYFNGIQKGPIEYFDEMGSLIRRAHFEQGELEGIDTEFFPLSQMVQDRSAKSPIPHLQVTWRKGILQGPVRSWFSNGQLRSYHERVDNKREGICTSYYPNGQIKLLETYASDLLQEGNYFALDNFDAVSVVKKGFGTASFFDDQGLILNRVTYQGGMPINGIQ